MVIICFSAFYTNLIQKIKVKKFYVLICSTWNIVKEQLDLNLLFWINVIT